VSSERKRYVWIVEIQDSASLLWYPWCYAFPSDAATRAKDQLKIQREAHQNDKFRIRKYVRQP
jgi:hypothetical protein